MSLTLRLTLLLVRLCAPIVPSSHRASWRMQWTADLWHYAHWLAMHGPSGRGRRSRRLIARASGLLVHAVSLRLDEWSPRMLSHDIKYAWRTLVRRPAFAAVAILILGLGIGANATIFSWVESIVLQPLPGVDATRLIALHGKTAARDDLSFSYLNFVDLRAARPDGIEDLFAFRGVAMNLTRDGDARRVWGQMVSPNFLDVLRVHPLHGRGFLETEGTVKDTAPVAILTYEAWQELFAGRADTVGRTITLNARQFTIVGVTPPGFRGTMIGFAVDLFVPLTMQRAFMSGDRLEQRGGGFLQVYGRLANGASPQQAQASLDVAAARLERDYPVNEGRGVFVEPVWRDGAAGLMLPVMATLMVVVAIVLLIACANLAGLVLARAADRQREVAVLAALGASRGRLIRQLFAESAILTVGGGLAGILLASWTSGLLMALMPPTPFPLAFDAGVGTRGIAYAALTSAVAAIAFGLLPALRTSRLDVGPALKGAPAGIAGAARSRARGALVVAQVALSLVLLICAALFLRGLAQARTVDRGFGIREGAIAALDLLPNGYDQRRGSAFHQQLIERVNSIPSVEAATVAASMPLDIGGGSQLTFAIPGYTAADGEELEASYNLVGDGYFETMRIPVVSGRPLDARDIDGKAVAIVINETMATRFWSGADPVGRTVTIGKEHAVVVGIARDGKYLQLNEQPRNFMYMSIAQFFRHDALLIVRTTGDPEAVVPSLHAEVKRLDPDLPLFDVRTVAEHMKLSVFIPRMASIVLALFGGLALLLSVVGLYSVVAYSVAQRTREIGVRVALGASRSSVMRLVLVQGFRLILIGLVIGGALSAAAAQALRSQLVGVAPLDPIAFAGTIALLTCVAVLACLAPARRATRLDPVSALRSE